MLKITKEPVEGERFEFQVSRIKDEFAQRVELIVNNETIDVFEIGCPDPPCHEFLSINLPEDSAHEQLTVILSSNLGENKFDFTILEK